MNKRLGVVSASLALLAAGAHTYLRSQGETPLKNLREALFPPEQNEQVEEPSLHLQYSVEKDKLYVTNVEPECNIMLFYDMKTHKLTAISDVHETSQLDNFRDIATAMKEVYKETFPQTKLEIFLYTKHHLLLTDLLEHNPQHLHSWGEARTIDPITSEYFCGFSFDMKTKQGGYLAKIPGMKNLLEIEMPKQRLEQLL